MIYLKYTLKPVVAADSVKIIDGVNSISPATVQGFGFRESNSGLAGNLGYNFSDELHDSVIFTETLFKEMTSAGSNDSFTMTESLLKHPSKTSDETYNTGFSDYADDYFVDDYVDHMASVTFSEVFFKEFTKIADDVVTMTETGLMDFSKLGSETFNFTEQLFIQRQSYFLADYVEAGYTES
jgi:hypothetical protein